MTTAVQAAVQSEVVLRTVAIELGFDSGAVRVNGSPVDLTLFGETFVGVGGLGALSAVSESNESRSYDCTFALSGIPRDAIGIAMTEPYQGRRATIWEVVIDRDSGQPLADPVVIFRGHMDQLNPTLGESCTVSVRMVNRLADWEVARNVLYTDIEQQRLHPGDLGLQFVGAVVQKRLIWPARSWWDHNS
jgi:hypothetical protein